MSGWVKLWRKVVCHKSRLVFLICPKKKKYLNFWQKLYLTKLFIQLNISGYWICVISDLTAAISGLVNIARLNKERGSDTVQNSM